MLFQFANLFIGMCIHVICASVKQNFKLKFLASKNTPDWKIKISGNMKMTPLNMPSIVSHCFYGKKNFIHKSMYTNNSRQSIWISSDYPDEEKKTQTPQFFSNFWGYLRPNSSLKIHQNSSEILEDLTIAVTLRVLLYLRYLQLLFWTGVTFSLRLFEMPQFQ